MTSFGVFSFERYNGILGDEPTNNRSIEVQMISRFVSDNSHLQLLMSAPSGDIVSEFTHVVLEHALSFTSTRHLDMKSSNLTIDRFVPAKKYQIGTFSSTEMAIFTATYKHLYADEHNEVYLPSTYRKMTYCSINGQHVKKGQYVSCRWIFPFRSTETSTQRTVFTDSSYRPAKVEYFFTYTVQHTETESTTKSFACVYWPMTHPLRNAVGKPYEVWCLSLQEYCSKNMFVPTDYIGSFLLTAQQKYEDENTLLTVPLI